MIPVVTPEEMAAIDAASPEPLEVLVGRAGGAVARAAVAMLGGAYGRRVVVVAGKGNNGADGREAARRLRRRGVDVVVVEATDQAERLPPADLVIDAGYGTGYRGGAEGERAWRAPDPGGAPVLAVDIPSGVDGGTGQAGAGVLRATRTVTFAALKPGLLFDPGAELAGRVDVADIGLDVSSARAHVVEDPDVAAWLPPSPRTTHKWRSAVWVIAGSPGMAGAAVLAAGAARRAGAGYVRLSSPGVQLGGAMPTATVDAVPTEVVGTELPAEEWCRQVLDGAGRFQALVVGPGLGSAAAEDVRALVSAAQVPIVVDGDGLNALGADVGRLARPTTVLTPHDGEYERLCGHPPGADRLAAARALATAAGCTVLLKGSTTVVADSGGAALISVAGGARLATAGTGDVLSGAIAALLAQGVPPLAAAAGAAHLHGVAAHLGWARGLVAGDLVDLLPAAIARMLPEA